MIQIEEYVANKKQLYDSTDIYGSWLYINHNITHTATFTQTFGEDILDFLRYNNQISQKITIQDDVLSGTFEQPIGKIKTDGFGHNISIDFSNVFNLIESINIDYRRENYTSDYDGMVYFGDAYSLQYNISVEKITNNPNINQDKEFDNINNIIKDVLFLDIDIEDINEKRQVSYSRGNYVETRYYFLYFS